MGSGCQPDGGSSRLRPCLDKKSTNWRCLSGVSLTSRFFSPGYNTTQAKHRILQPPGGDLMAANQARLDSLWKRVEDARLQWQFAHNYVKQVNEDRDGMPPADGSYAHLRSLGCQRLAVQNYLRALQDFKAALAAEQASNGAAPEPAVTAEAIKAADAAITPRERQVLALIVSGSSSKQIAAQLGMAFRTAVCHRYRLYQKLKVHTNVELTRAAMRMGLIEL